MCSGGKRLIFGDLLCDGDNASETGLLSFPPEKLKFVLKSETGKLSFAADLRRLYDGASLISSGGGRSVGKLIPAGLDLLLLWSFSGLVPLVLLLDIFSFSSDVSNTALRKPGSDKSSDNCFRKAAAPSLSA